MSDHTVQNFHLIRVKYFGPTDNRGSRVKLISNRFSGGPSWNEATRPQDSVMIPYDHALNNTADMADAWLIAHGFEIVGHGELASEYVVITSTFKSLKEAQVA